jgi:azurin
MRSLKLVLPLAFVALVAACGKDDVHPVETKGTTNPQPAQTQAAALPTPAEAPKPAETAPAKPAQKVELAIATVANTMAFDKKTLTAPAGAEVHLTIKNNATMATLPHNWVLVKPGTEASVAANGLKLGEPAGFFDVRDKNALAHTPMAKPGESTEVTFTAPSEPGDYPYICTYPGHYMMMKGVLTVTQ